MIDQEKMKEFLQAHELIIRLSNDLKALKKTKHEYEADIADALDERKIDVVDTTKYRIYRYDKRLVPYKRK